MDFIEFIDQFSNLLSALVGGIVAIFGQIFVVWFQDGPKRRLDEDRKALLRLMLEPQNMPTVNGNKAEWRNFSTLRDVVGADDETAKRLLIQIGARRNTGVEETWALIKHHPLISADPNGASI